MHLGEFVAGVRGIVVAGTVDGAVDAGVSGGALLRAIWPLARDGCGPWHGRFSKVCVEEMPWHGWAHSCGFDGEEMLRTAAHGTT